MFYDRFQGNRVFDFVRNPPLGLQPTLQYGYAQDISQVTWGSLTLAQGGNLGTIYYTDFVTGTGAYTVKSSSLGTLNCGTLAASRCRCASVARR